MSDQTNSTAREGKAEAGVTQGPLVQKPAASAEPSPPDPEGNKGFTSLLKQTLQEFGDDDCTMMAASLSYYTVFSLAPLVYIIVFIAGFFVQQAAVQREILRQISDMVGTSAADQVQTMLQLTSQKAISGGGVSLLVSFGVLLVAVTGVFAQLQAALNRAWSVSPDPDRRGIKSFLGKRFLSLGMVLVIGFLLLVSLALSAMIGAIGAHLSNLLPDYLSEGTLRTLNFGVSFAVFTLLFAAIYKWLPDAVIRWRDVWIGAVGTATLFALGKMALGVYLGRSDFTVYGAGGALVLILIWVYYSSIILLFGAEFTQVWARHYGTQIMPVGRAVRVVRRFEHVKQNRGQSKKHS